MPKRHLPLQEVHYLLEFFIFLASNTFSEEHSFFGPCALEKYQTRRERLKSALYLRLKKRKVFKIVKRGTLSTF